MTYRLSKEVELPANAATSTYAFLGTRGSGKTYGAGVLVEEFLSSGVQVVVVDPVGVWWALRLDANGRDRGLDIPVFGGIHADLPLEPTAGELVATLVVERGMSAVLDVSDWTDGQQRRFVEAFARTLFQLKKRSKSPTHLVFEEAHEFFPQVVDGALAPMVGATKRLWKVGRNYGIGGSLISTRAAEINKNALNISDRIITGKLAAPEDVKRIKDWASSNGVNADQVAALPSLPKGQLIVWRDPGEGGAVVTTFRRKVTFDASRTPEAGDVQPATNLPALDLAAVRQAMAATIEEAKASDPKALRGEIERLRKQLNVRPDQVDLDAHVSALKRAEAERDTARRAMADLLEKHGMMWRTIHEALRATETMPAVPMGGADVAVLPEVNNLTWDGSNHSLGAFPGSVAPKFEVEVQRLNTALPSREEATKNAAAGRAPWEPQGSRFYPPPALPRSAAPYVAGGGARMLRALAQRHPTKLSPRQLGVLAAMKPSGGSFRTYLSRLVTTGRVARDGGLLGLTPDGVRDAGPVTKPTTPRALLSMWAAGLPRKATDMLEWLTIQSGPRTKAEVADFVALDIKGGTFRTYFSKLASNGLVSRAAGGRWQAAPELVSAGR